MLGEYKYVSEEIATAFRIGFLEGENEINKFYINITELNKKNKINIIEHNNSFEVNGFFISKDNLNKPLSSKIEQNSLKINKGKPQAWEFIINDNTESSDGIYKWFELYKRIFPWLGHISEKKAKKLKQYPISIWFYNTLWAIEETNYRWMKIPNNEEILFILNSISGNSLTKAKLLHIPFVWCRTANFTWKIYFTWVLSFLLSASHFKNAGERCVRLSYNGKKAIGTWIDCWWGASVRPLLIKKWGK